MEIAEAVALKIDCFHIISFYRRKIPIWSV